MPLPRTSRVFLPEPDSRYDTSDASRFGTVCLLSNERNDPRRTFDTYEDLKARLALHEFNSEDYLCTTGSPLVITLMILAASDICEGNLRLLVFNSRTGKYDLSTLPANRKEKTHV